MALSDEAQIVEIWEGFAAEDFRYASHDGQVRDFGDANDQRRERLPIRQNLLEQFLDGEIDVESFKSEMASEAGSNKLWGYSGPSGGMFFNMLVSAADSEDAVSELTRLLREVLHAPGDRETAAQNIQRLEEHVEQLRSKADNIQSAPQTGYIPYFLSYFWQLQEPDTYPIYYRSMRDALSELGIWEASGSLSEDYLNFWALNEEIRDVLEEHAARDIHLWTIERMFLYWLSRNEIASPETSLTDEQEAILELWRDAASRHARAKHFNFGGKYTPDDAHDLADEFIENPNELAFKSLWDPMHSAQRAGSAEVICEKWTDEKGKSDEELADLIAEIKSATKYDPSWETELGAKRTVWELFGLLHIEQYPIINGSTEQGLAFFGYETPADYGGAVEEFEAFKRDYQQIVGHATADTGHAVPQNLEIDQLLNVIDKVSEEDPDQATHDEVAQLYSAVLEATGEQAENDEEVLIDPGSRRPPKAWQVAPDGSRELWNAWADHDVMSIGWAQLGSLRGLTKSQIAHGFDTDTPSNDVTTIHHFANSIMPGDVVIARDGRNAIDGIGVVTSEYYYDPTQAESLLPDRYDDHHHFIDVEWTVDFVDEYGESADRPEVLPMFAMPTVRGYGHIDELQRRLVDQYPDLTETFAHLEARQSELSTDYWARDGAAGGSGAGEPEPLAPIPDPPDNAATIERQLRRAGQLVFHGPPGTGKTYTAQRFARWWLDQRSSHPTADQLEVVTFHPSFTYEDFIEGLTATAHEGTVEYSVEDGVFKALCQRAQEAYEADPAEPDPFVLIIDEINRGNLAQIFGETITLLEPDKRLDAENETQTTLPHSGEKFTVPPNVYLIGTMNTADRSIALVDAALRRRFRFIAFPPKMAVLYEEHGFDGAAAVEAAAETEINPVRQLIALSLQGIETLNESIIDAPDLGRGKQIGHSYLMGIDGGTTANERLRSIVEAWQYEILPLLEEYYFGQFDRIEQDLLSGGGGRLFDWETQQVKDFSPEDLAQTLLTLCEVSAEWRGVEPEASETVFTFNYLLEQDVLQPGDELVFDDEKVPESATRAFDEAAAFWRCEVTGETGQQNNVRWQHNDEQYSLTGLARTILDEVASQDGQVRGPRYWRHPRFDDRRLLELREDHEAGELETAAEATVQEVSE